MTIIADIDLRPMHGSIRDQGDRPTCMAFALSDLNGHRHQQPAQLSAEYLYREAALLMPGWKPGDGLAVDAALRAVSAPGQALETAVPYIAIEPSLPLDSNPCCAPLFAGSFSRQIPLMGTIESALLGDRSVGLVLRLTMEFFHATAQLPQVPYSPLAIFGQSHAVVAVGVGNDIATNERHVLIRNSWGLGWGDNGHAWLPESYILTHTICAFGD
jgi:hypothetical protein